MILGDADIQMVCFITSGMLHYVNEQGKVLLLIAFIWFSSSYFWVITTFLLSNNCTVAAM